MWNSGISQNVDRDCGKANEHYFAKCDHIFSVKSEMANIDVSRSRRKAFEMMSNGMENSEWCSLHFYVGSNMA